MPQPAPNRNTFYAQTFVDALVRSGLDAVCIAPGSRSTPLTLAFAEREREVGDVKVYSHLDERSAGFFALGLSMASDRPTALVCTSGTATANFFPAIIEANMSCVPLIVLTADRPHELRHSGANQTIDQVKLYGDHVLWFVDMALPEAAPPAVAVRNVRTTAARAVATAMGRMAWRRKGVVHLNFPFRKPLEPVAVAGDEMGAAADLVPELCIEAGPTICSPAQAQRLAAVVNENANGLIVLGPESALSPDAVATLADVTGYGVLADTLSGVRYEGIPQIVAYETILQHAPPTPTPDVVLRFGRVPVSKWLGVYLAQHPPQHHVHIGEAGDWSDDAHLVTWRLSVRPLAVVDTLKALCQAGPNRENTVKATLEQADAVVRERLQPAMLPYFDGGVIARVVRKLPTAARVFVGNSSPIRHLEQFVMPGDGPLRVHASRGASGIDGQVSTALGIGAATGEHVYAIFGDITFYHDMNGLLAVRRNNVSATFVVVNNNGGGVFDRLPIRDFEPYHTEQFLTPHGLTFEHAAAMYGLEYAVAGDFASLDAALDQYMKPGISAIIEVQTDIKRDEARRKGIVKAVQDELRKQFGGTDG